MVVGARLVEGLDVTVTVRIVTAATEELEIGMKAVVVRKNSVGKW